MIIDCIADLHGFYPKLDGGDLLIIAGDITASDKSHQWVEFFKWLAAQDYQKKVFIGGNHDNFLAQCIPTEVGLKLGLSEYEGYDYLLDSGTEFQYWESGKVGVGLLEDLKIWGTPWTPWFDGVHPSCKAFMLSEKELKNKFALIPKDTDILISHGPPFGMLDTNIDGEYCGSKSLSDKLLKLQLKLHIFGHIHEAYGQCNGYYLTDYARDINPTPNIPVSINCSHVNFHYKPVNKPVRIVL